MISQSEQADDRKSYEPPRLATISLRPEEAVLGACKTLHGAGPQGSGCFFQVGCNSNVGS